MFLFSVDCQDPSCSGHGFCVSGTCVCRSVSISLFRNEHISLFLLLNICFFFCSIFACCRKGWRGTNCDQVDDDEKQVKKDQIKTIILIIITITIIIIMIIVAKPYKTKIIIIIRDKFSSNKICMLRSLLLKLL